MYRKRAWRRHKNYVKAKRKREISISISWYHPIFWNDFDDGVYKLGWYNNLHQYSKNKVHCSCHLCSAKTRNKGKRRQLRGNYAPSINYKIMDKRRQMAMDEDEKEFFN